MSSADNSYRLQLNNLMQSRRESWKPEYATTGQQHEEVHTCTIFVKGIQYGSAMKGRTKNDAFEAAARSALADYRNKHGI
ncbi:hypothetical protein D9619_013106 [Psilocybe cf. subviscida]|uniref:DRBM domain-containing protein n=1 Tax=Psilocybe cf. subviscida TaxID=2480587 RepID=A0A8H5AZT8_9AGAR|nr:hypothetical protein D9619_013106 [Psilocybe cf. subviscida]